MLGTCNLWDGARADLLRPKEAHAFQARGESVPQHAAHPAVEVAGALLG